jgi:hypothetical protein
MTLLASCVWEMQELLTKHKTTCAYRAEKVILCGGVVIYDHPLDVIISAAHVIKLSKLPRFFATPSARLSQTVLEYCVLSEITRPAVFIPPPSAEEPAGISRLSTPWSIWISKD